MKHFSNCKSICLISIFIRKKVRKNGSYPACKMCLKRITMKIETMAKVNNLENQEKKQILILGESRSNKTLLYKKS